MPFVPRTREQSEQAVGKCVDPALGRALLGTQEDGSAGELFKPLKKPKAGDWLQTRDEPGQTYTEWSRKMTNRGSAMALPRRGCDTLLVCPVGASFESEIGRRFMPHLIEWYSAFFAGARIEVLERPLSLKDARSRENDFGHKQYLIKDIFEMLHTHKDVVSKSRAYCRLAITLEDIYPGEEWNYVYGQANLMERVAVFSFARHSPLFYHGIHAEDALAQLSVPGLMHWLRANRHTMAHETCHMFNFRHCVFWHCLMNGSNGPGDSNGATSFLCPCCLRKLMQGLSALKGETQVRDVDERYVGMQKVLQEFAAEHDPKGLSGTLAKDLKWLEFRRDQLKELVNAAPPPPPPPPSVSAGGRDTRRRATTPSLQLASGPRTRGSLRGGPARAAVGLVNENKMLEESGGARRPPPSGGAKRAPSRSGFLGGPSRRVGSPSLQAVALKVFNGPV